jgi:hypothetical protein
MNSWPLPALITTDVRSRNIATNELIATFARCDIRRIPMLFRYTRPSRSESGWNYTKTFASFTRAGG